MKLSLKDRIVITDILPAMGNFATLTIKKDLLEKLNPTQEEIAKYEITSEGDIIKWNKNKEEDKEVEFTDLELNMIKDSLKKLESQGKLNDSSFDIYKIFIQ